MIEFHEISKTYKESLSRKSVRALEGLSLQIHDGEVFGFLGPNGAGKSTAIKVLINLIRPSSGNASILGHDVGNRKVRHSVGYLPENPYFYDHLTAEELLWFGGRANGMEATLIRRRSSELLDRVNLLDSRKRPLRSYSKGMVQRAGLAFALIHDPQVVILDEPMSGLDPIGRRLVVDLIQELRAQGKTIFFSSHILNDVERLCDRASILVNGRLRLVDTMPNLLREAGTLEDLFLQVVARAGKEEGRA